MPAWMRGKGGRPEEYCHRRLLDAVRYVTDNGIKWRAVPVDYPPWSAVYAFFIRWRGERFIDHLHDVLRDKVRIGAGRDPEPTAAIVDSQSVRAAQTVGRDSRGCDQGKKVGGRKRHIAVDVMGLLLSVVVTALRQHAGKLVDWATETLPLVLELAKRPTTWKGSSSLGSGPARLP